MEIAPLALVVLLGYGLLIAVSLTTWTAVAYSRQESEPDARQAEPRTVQPAAERPRSKRQISNDEVRGARSRRSRSGNDPFQADEKATVAAVDGSPKAAAPEPVSWKRETVAPAKESGKTGSRDKVGEEDAFERFLSSRPDDFDIR